jgi:serine/threonine-protein kinase
MSPDPETLLATAIGGYIVNRFIGHGTFAWVFEATPPGGGPSVALKVLRPPLAVEPAFREVFENECRLAAELEHPHIVPTQDVGCDGDAVFLVMGLCPTSLSATLAQEGPLEPGAAADLGRQIGGALEFAHQKGYLHRDVKTANVLRDATGAWRLADFGIAQAIDTCVHQAHRDVIVGTPHYISPERAQGRPVDARSDLYSLGVTLYVAITGEPPFHATDWYDLARMHVEDRPVPPRKRRHGFPRDLNRIVMRLLEKHPDDRHQTAADLVRDLERAQHAG